MPIHADLNLMSVDTVIVLVNFLGADLVNARAVEALASGHRVVVADNSGEYTGAGEVVRPDVNLGFGAGCNLAVSSATGETNEIPTANGSGAEWICLANPDTRIEPGLVTSLVEYAQSQDLDIVAPTLMTCAGKIERGYRQPNLPRELALTAVALLRQRRSQQRGPVPTQSVAVSHSRAAKPPLLERLSRRGTGGPRFGSGAFLVIRRSAWRTVGGFDERFVLYGEDLDLWYRMERSGLSCGFADHIVVEHAQGKGSPTPRIDRDVLRWAGIELFEQLHHGAIWRRYRWLHERALQLSFGTDSDRPDSGVMKLIVGAWNSGNDAIETGQILRTAFDNDLMRPTSASEETVEATHA